jgi:hypothetical protein
VLPRLQLFEIEDQAWCPESWRDGLTDFLGFLMGTFAPYRVVAAPLAAALRDSRTSAIVDLCAGGGGPWEDLAPRLAREGTAALRVHLCDLYPNQAAFGRLVRGSGGVVSAEATPVDASAVPAHLEGFRTLFTALHHFPPGRARAILADAVRGRHGIGVFEVTQRSPLALAGMLVLPLLLLVVAPFIRPFRWWRLLWTYLVPVLPLVVWWDATVSCLRSYTAAELLALAQQAGPDYRWRSGARRAPPWPTAVTYLIGTPPPRHGASVAAG